MVEVVVDGIRVQHREPGPWRSEVFSSGLGCIMNAAGINWAHFPDKRGAVLFSDLDLMERAVSALNGGDNGIH